MRPVAAQVTLRTLRSQRAHPAPGVRRRRLGAIRRRVTCLASVSIPALAWGAAKQPSRIGVARESVLSGKAAACRKMTTDPLELKQESMAAFTLVVALTSVALIAFGIAIATDYRGYAGIVADFIAGPARTPRPQTDRFWSILPLSLGVGSVLSLALNSVNLPASGFVEAGAVAVYYAAMMLLAWRYTPAQRRALGPFFWTRRAAAIPLLAFFLYAALISLPLLLRPTHS